MHNIIHLLIVVTNIDGNWDRRVPLTLQDQFDIASCQFAMHYMFQTEAKAHHFFTEVARHLKPGGVFIATTMDCRVLAESLAKLIHGPFDDDASMEEEAGISSNSCNNASNNGTVDNNHSNNTSEFEEEDKFARIKELAAQHSDMNSDKVLTYKNDVGSTILRVKFAHDMWTRLLVQKSKEEENESSGSNSDRLSKEDFGIRYTFTLQDSTTDAAVDAPEWVVPLGPPLKALAAAHGLELVETQNFQDIMHDMMSNSGKVNK